MAPTLIQICRIQWWSSAFLLQTETTFSDKVAEFNDDPSFDFDRKYPFRANLVQKLRIINLGWNLIPRLIIYAEFWWCSLFLFSTGNTVLGQSWTNKTKIVSLSWNLVPRLIRICKIPWRCSFFLFKTEIPFLGKLSVKKIASLSWNFLPRLIQICRIHWRCSLFSFSTENTLLGKNVVPKVKVVFVFCESEIWCLVQFEYAEVSGDVHFFFFQSETLFWGKFCPKLQKCLCKVKFGTQSNSNIQNAKVMFTFCFYAEFNGDV